MKLCPKESETAESGRGPSAVQVSCELRAGAASLALRGGATGRLSRRYVLVAQGLPGEWSMVGCFGSGTAKDYMGWWFRLQLLWEL